ncbi:hypothetical protein KSP39_PZI011082 [Platanthera zijinensis]|uniref:Uncharacterized protein n=1 Tax=Platanthera zijinensis TaxID=2320716 RepID=A0AAP0BHK1_9ASPA
MFACSPAPFCIWIAGDVYFARPHSYSSPPLVIPPSVFFFRNNVGIQYSIVSQSLSETELLITKMAVSPSIIAWRFLFGALGCFMLASLLYTILTDGSPFRLELLTPSSIKRRWNVPRVVHELLILRRGCGWGKVPTEGCSRREGGLGGGYDCGLTAVGLEEGCMGLEKMREAAVGPGEGCTGLEKIREVALRLEEGCMWLEKMMEAAVGLEEELERMREAAVGIEEGCTGLEKMREAAVGMEEGCTGLDKMREAAVDGHNLD